MISYEEAKWISNHLWKSFVNFTNSIISDNASLENIIGELDFSKSCERIEMLEEASNFCVVAALMVESDIKERQSTAYFNL